MSQPPSPPAPPSQTYRRSRVCACARCRMGGLMGPVVLITVGVLLMMGQWTPYDFGDLWPVLLIAIGAVKLIESTASTEGHQG